MSEALTQQQPTITQLKYGGHKLSAYGHEAQVSEPLQTVCINAPSFYKDPDFLKWLNSPEANPATWHGQGQPGEDSDVFIKYGGAFWTAEHGFTGEGSDYPTQPGKPGIPHHIYAMIAEAVKHTTGSSETECIVWISNL